MIYKKLFIIIIFLWTLLLGAYCQNIDELQANIKSAEQISDTIAMARAWYNLGKYYEVEQQLAKSNNAFSNALFWAKSISSSKAITSIANYFASNYSSIGKSDSSIYYYKIALKASVANGDSSQVPIVLINLGDEYSYLGNHVTAANYALSAIRIKETLKDSANLSFFYQKTGELYKLAGETEKWEEYINKAYKLIHNSNYADIPAVAAVYNDLGGIAENRGDYEQALLFYDTLTIVGKKNNYPRAIRVALSNRASIYKQQGFIDKAMNTALKAIKYNSNVSYHKIYDYNLLAELYLTKNDLNKALKNALLAINHKAANSFPDEKMRGYKILYQVEKIRGNFAKALLWHENYKQLSDSLRDKQISTQILDMEIAYETEKKEQKIELLSAENKLKTQRINAGFGVVATLIIIILLIIYISNIRKNQAQLKQNNLQQQLLRAQMNPHFIFNVLGSIQNYMMANEGQKASRYLSQFASLTRATLEYSAEDTITLSDEIAMLKNYLELEQMRTPDKFEFEIIYDEDLETDFIQMPPMLVQPFIENAVKHGFKNIDYHGKLSLSISDKVEFVEFVIEDNGTGIEEKSNDQKNHRSMAMTIFKKRRKLIQQKHKRDFNFTMLNLQDVNPGKTGVRINIDIPILNHD